jgi:flagellar biosynthesis component FlhA
MIRQSASKGPASTLAYTTVSVVIWVIYVALVLLLPQVLLVRLVPLSVAASVLVTAVVLLPLRRRAARAAKQRLSHR